MTFIRTIIEYMAVNGTIVKSALVDQPPFNQHYEDGIFGMLSDESSVARELQVVDRIHQNAIA